jgi:protein-disulfide isomerase
MKENELNVHAASDAEILEGVRKHMSNIEPLVPPPPTGDWNEAATAERSRRTVIRSRIGFAGLAPLVLVAAVVTVAVGFGLGFRGSPGVSGGGPYPAGSTVNITYRLVPPGGGSPSAAEMDGTVTVLEARLSAIFQVARVVDSGGSPLPANDASGPVGYSVTAQPPDRVVVTYQADYRIVAGTVTWDADTIRASLGLTGQVEFVDLPAGIYGTAGAPGSKSIPQKGDTLDDALPALLTGSDVDTTGLGWGWGSNDVVAAQVPFKGAAAATLAAYSTANRGHYLAVTVDGVVRTTVLMTGSIENGLLQLSTGLTRADAESLDWLLAHGTLPVPLSEVDFALVTPRPQGVGQVADPGAPDVLTPSSIPTNGRTLGNANAPHTIDVYEDFQCPLCKNFTTDIQPVVVANYVATGKAKLVFHDFLVIDQNIGGTESLDAANAATCAADQGKFWPYHDWLFANQHTEGSGAFSKDRLKAIAAAAGIPDLTAFNSCVDNGSHNAEITAEQSQMPLDVLGVPAITIDGGAVLNSYDYATISAALNQVLGPLQSDTSTVAAPTMLVPQPESSAASSPTATATP